MNECKMIFTWGLALSQRTILRGVIHRNEPRTEENLTFMRSQTECHMTDLRHRVGLLTDRTRHDGLYIMWNMWRMKNAWQIAKVATWIRIRHDVN